VNNRTLRLCIPAVFTVECTTASAANVLETRWGFKLSPTSKNPRVDDRARLPRRTSKVDPFHIPLTLCPFTLRHGLLFPATTCPSLAQLTSTGLRRACSSRLFSILGREEGGTCDGFGLAAKFHPQTSPNSMGQGDIDKQIGRVNRSPSTAPARIREDPRERPNF
jgi:hypothetical protein